MKQLQKWKSVIIIIIIMIINPAWEITVCMQTGNVQQYNIYWLCGIFRLITSSINLQIEYESQTLWETANKSFLWASTGNFMLSLGLPMHLADYYALPCLKFWSGSGHRKIKWLTRSQEKDIADSPFKYFSSS